MNRTRTAPHVLCWSAALSAAAGLAFSASAMAQPAGAPMPTPARATAAPRATPTPIVLLETSGPVQVRPPQPEGTDRTRGWERPRPGMTLVEGSQIRTGLTGSAVFQVGATQRVTVDKMTSLTIRLAVNDAGTERTRIDLPQGRLGVSVDSTRIPNDVQIATPQTTLAVTGTDFVVEHNSAFGTYAKGTETNTGSFNMTYVTGAVATVTGNQESSVSTPDPAAVQQQRTQINTADPGARESDEVALAQRASGSGDALGLNLGFSPSATSLITSKPITGDPPAAIMKFIGYDQINGRVFESDLSGTRRRTIVETAPVFPAAPFSGLSIIGQESGARTLYLLRSDVDLRADDPRVSNRLYSLDLSNPTVGFAGGAEILDSSKALMLGMGSIGSQLFAHGFSLERSDVVESVYEIAPAVGTFREVMQLPGVEIGGAAGSNERGSLFLAGRLHLEDGSNQHVFLEVDPRTNYMIGAYGGTGMEFAPSDGTIMPIGLDPGSIDNISGLAVVDGVLVMSATARVNDQLTNVVVQYDPAATGTQGNPRLRRIEALEDGSFVAALASERGIAPRASRVLDNPPGRIDLETINPTFGRMAYGEEALASNILERMVGNEIIKTARDPQGCAASAALDALPSILQRHVNKTSGVGRSVAEFRDSLPFMHPCGARNR